MTEHVLISPLGFSPGAVSGVYFALEQKNIKANQIITVGTAHQGVRNAAAILNTLFRKVNDVAYKACYIDAEELCDRVGGTSGSFAARMGLYIDRAQRSGQTVHVAVTGGRSGMGALAALAAQIYRAHHLYHLWVDEEIERWGADPMRVRPDPDNCYVNPTIKGKNAWSLVSLPFLDLSDLIKDAEKYRRSGQVSANWTAERLVGEGPAMFKALSYYVPAGLTIARAEELLELVAEWRDGIEWITQDDPTKKMPIGKIDLAGQKAIWDRVLSILYTAGALDDKSRESLRRLMNESISNDYAQRKLKDVAQQDEVGILQQLTAHKEIIITTVTVSTFILAVVELWLKAQGII